MADCAAVGCTEPALDVWRPNQKDAPRFHYLVCQFHALALRSNAGYRIDGPELHIDALPRLLDWTLTQSGGKAIVGIFYGDDLETVKVNLEADPAMLRALGESIVATEAHDDDASSWGDQRR